jgi:integrase
MKKHQLGEGPHKVTIYPNGQYFVVVWRVGGVRKKESARSWEEAQQIAEEKYRALKESRAEASLVPVPTLMYWQECIAKLGATPLHEAVDFYLMHRPVSVSKNADVAKLFEKYVNYGEVSEDTRRARKVAKKMLVAKLGSSAIQEVSAEAVSSLLRGMDDKGYAARSKFNIWTTLRAFFNWARDVEKVLPRNLPTVCEEIPRPQFTIGDPEFYTPAELTAIFANLPEHWWPGFAIRAFMGVRRAEVLRLDWGTFMNWEEHMLLLPSAITKTKRRRTVEAPANAMEFLVAGRKKSGPLLPGNGWDSRVFLKAREKAGVPAKDNGLRHGFATYHLALNKNSTLTAKLAGNSVRVLEENYTGLAGSNEANSYFSITPDLIKSYKSGPKKLLKIA